MNSLEKLNFRFVRDDTMYGRRQIVYVRADYHISVIFESLLGGEPFIQVIYGGELLTNNEILKINTAINKYWNENKDKFKRGE